MAFTFFFRDLQTLDLIKEHALPALKGRRHIDIWDAGCAMGPEPYTLAMIIRQSMGHFQFRNVRLFATDIDDSNLFGKIICDGVYPHEQVQRIPEEFLSEYFKPLGDGTDRYLIREDLRGCVRFQQHDLLSLQPIRSNLSLILCKNVLLHFSEGERVDVLRMFHDALDDGGFLATEQTQKMPREIAPLFEPVVSNAQIYRKVSQSVVRAAG